MFQDFGRVATQLLGVHRRTRLSWIVQVWVAFVISGAVHGFAFSLEPSTGNSFVRFKAILRFFMLQALGLTVENLFLTTPGRDLALYEVGLEDEMIMGRLWTFGWLLFSGYWALDCWLDTSSIMAPGIAVVLPLLKRSWRVHWA